MAHPKSRSRINPDLVAAIGDSRITNSQLAQRAGFAQPQIFSSLLHAQLVVPSLRTVARLEIVAKIIGFDGPIFTEEFPAVSRDAFDGDHIPEPRT